MPEKICRSVESRDSVKIHYLENRFAPTKSSTEKGLYGMKEDAAAVSEKSDYFRAFNLVSSVVSGKDIVLPLKHEWKKKWMAQYVNDIIATLRLKPSL